jgi:hypothetical protein
MYRFKYEVESGPSLKLTRAGDCPGAFSGFSSRWTSRALNYVKISHNRMPPFADVRRGTHPRYSNEGKIGLSILEESIGHAFFTLSHFCLKDWEHLLLSHQ